VIESEILCDTYTPECVEALSIIKYGFSLSLSLPILPVAFELTQHCQNPPRSCKTGSTSGCRKSGRQAAPVSEVGSQHFCRPSQRILTSRSVGMGFDKLVEEYAKIVDQIKEKEWALNEIRARTQSVPAKI
jgi:hypothetical protein